MCLYADTETTEAKRLRRRAATLPACAATLAAGPALDLTKGHHAVVWAIIGLQACLVSISIGLLAKSRRLAANSTNQL